MAYPYSQRTICGSMAHPHSQQTNCGSMAHPLTADKLWHNGTPTLTADKLWHNGAPTITADKLWHNGIPTLTEDKLWLNGAPTFTADKLWLNGTPTQADKLWLSCRARTHKWQTVSSMVHLFRAKENGAPQGAPVLKKGHLPNSGSPHRVKSGNNTVTSLSLMLPYLHSRLFEAKFSDVT
jgi:hypothetical protein